MSYEKQNFTIGQKLRAAHLNHMENGIADLGASVYKDKKLSIMGDSISTFRDYIPDGNSVYYTGSNCGVATVEDTWWKKTMNALGMTLCVNQSWSGSSVTDCKDAYGENSYGHTDHRTSNLHNETANPDVIIVYIGTNDLITSSCAVGSYDGTSNTIPTDVTTFREAYAIMLNKITTNYPEAKLYCCTLIPNGYDSPIENMSRYTAFNKAIREVGTAFLAEIIELSACGVNVNAIDTYLGDGVLHPNAKGHSLIANQVIKTLDAGVRKRYE